MLIRWLLLLICLVLIADAFPLTATKKYRRIQLAKFSFKFDYTIDLLKSQTLAYGVGSVGLIVLLVNRLSVLEELNDVQSRVDLISVMACSALLLNALTEQDIEARERDAVTLVGYSSRATILNADISGEVASAYKWICDTVMKAGPVSSVQVIKDNQILARIGVVGNGDDRKLGDLIPGKILSKSMRDNEEVYLPDVQILPGKIEFTYLPLNCQAVLIVPFSRTGAIVVGSNKAKSLRLADLRRIRTAIELFRTAIS